MNYSTSSTSNFESPITPEELNQILTAISNGRYSWACVLILRSMGYNPLHYIPQRTYSRIAKENNPVVTTAVSTSQEALETINSHS